MNAYDVIIKSYRTGEECVVGTVQADTFAKAETKAVREWFGKWNMVWQQLVVRRREAQ